MNEDDSLQTKVFFIDFHKTGTTTMMQALNRVTGPNHVRDEDIADERIAAELSHRFDAFQDTSRIAVQV